MKKFTIKDLEVGMVVTLKRGTQLVVDDICIIIGENFATVRLRNIGEDKGLRYKFNKNLECLNDILNPTESNIVKVEHLKVVYERPILYYLSPIGMFLGEDYTLKYDVTSETWFIGDRIERDTLYRSQFTLEELEDLDIDTEHYDLTEV